MWLTREPNERPFAVLPASDAAAAWVARRSIPHPDGVALVGGVTPPADPMFRIYSISGTPDESGRRSTLVADLTPSQAAAGDPSPARLAEAAGVILLLPA